QSRFSDQGPIWTAHGWCPGQPDTLEHEERSRGRIVARLNRFSWLVQCLRSHAPAPSHFARYLRTPSHGQLDLRRYTDLPGPRPLRGYSHDEHLLNPYRRGSKRNNIRSSNRDYLL